MSVRTRKAYRADEAAGYELLTDADRRRAVKVKEQYQPRVDLSSH
jgi:hypothetical protein